MQTPSRTLKAIITALLFLPFSPACNSPLRNNYLNRSQTSLEFFANEISPEKLNQLVEDIEIIELIELERIHRSEGNFETSRKYTLQIGNRMLKYLTSKDKRYFEAIDELADYLRLDWKEEIRAKTPELLRLKKTFREYKQEGYKPPITEEEWKKTKDIYVNSLGQPVS